MSTMPDKVYLRQQISEESGSGVYEGTQNNGDLYLKATPVRQMASSLLMVAQEISDWFEILSDEEQVMFDKLKVIINLAEGK